LVDERKSDNNASQQCSQTRLRHKQYPSVSVPVAQKDVIALLFYPKVAFEGILNQAILRKSCRIAESGKDPSCLNRHMVAGDFVCSFPSPASRRTFNPAMQEKVISAGSVASIKPSSSPC
jgi:hypothetical protein